MNPHLAEIGLPVGNQLSGRLGCLMKDREILSCVGVILQHLG